MAKRKYAVSGFTAKARDLITPENLDNKGHMHEQSWVLINIFGLSVKQIKEIEREDGFTTEDILSPEFERWCRL